MADDDPAVGSPSRVGRVGLSLKYADRPSSPEAGALRPVDFLLSRKTFGASSSLWLPSRPSFTLDGRARAS